MFPVSPSREEIDAAMEAANELRWHFMTAPGNGDGDEREAEMVAALRAAAAVSDDGGDEPGQNVDGRTRR